jgi:hypothetical protein
MKAIKITFSAALIVLSHFASAQTGTWKLAGNSLTGTEKFGSKNSVPINFITNNVTRMSLTTTGQLGIGITAPEGNLHIFRGSAGTVSAFPSAPLVVENSTNNYINLLAPNASETGILFGKPESNISGGLIYNSSETPNGFQFRTNPNFTRMVLTSTGQLGVGTVKPNTNLHVFKGSSGATPFSNAPLAVENSTNNYINLLAPNANETGILFGKPESSISGGLIYNNTSTANGLQFRTNGNFTRMVLTNAGFLGVNTTTPLSELHIVHASIADGNHGLRLQNGKTGHQWTFYNNSGELELFNDNVLFGFFSSISGDYFSKSDARMKKDIETAPDVLSKVLQLGVKKYHFLENKTADKKHYGLIAQEVEKIFPEVVQHNIMDGSDKDYYTMNYSAYGVIAIKAIQEQQKKIEQQEQTNQEQQQKIITLEDRIAKLEAALNNGSVSNASSNNSIIRKEISGVTLEQNQPNPFNQSTVIHYHLPQGSAGQVNVYDMNGSLVKTLKADESGQAVVNGSDLKAGTYTYTLVVNGKIAASKKLVLVR